MRVFAVLVLILCASLSSAATLQVAVAANFASPLRQLVKHYCQQHP
ncbi:MAG: hypothetical protein R3292_03975 [Alcanivorax sp.]|nr:hypothetical protein [Alcanivorax sp.]